MPQAYLTKERAAKVSGRSVRRLLELANAGKIRKKIISDAKNNNRALALFHAGDIAALANGGTAALQISRPVRSPLAALPQPVASVIPPTPQELNIPILRPWLTVAEAADYSGLPASFLADLIDRKKLPALEVGVRPGGRWRISKRDVDAITAH